MRSLNVNKLTNFINKELSIKLENDIYNFSIEYANENNTPFLQESIYETKYNDILSVLKKDEDKKYLIKLIINNIISTDKIVYMKPEELNPELFENIIKKRELEEFKKNNRVGSSTFTCTKCKEKNCSISQKQTRSSDEPPTTFITCLECGYVFRYN